MTNQVRQAGDNPFAVSIADVEAAAQRISGVATKTPVLNNIELDNHCGGTVLLKPECLQRTGSFKFRGAYNRLSQLSADERKAGVVAWSSGNHAQGIAAAAQILGMPAAIVMPKDAPEVKAAKTRAYGAEIVAYDRYTESREEIGGALAKERGAVLVPSFEDHDIIAGQGTVGLELIQQTEGTQLDAVLVCCGGGGLTAGIAVALAAYSPETELYAVEPAGFDDHARSLASGKIEQIDPNARSICDALLTSAPGELTFSINRQRLSGGLVVTDDQVRDAMRFAFSNLKLVLEPGGSVALAAALSQQIPTQGKTIAVILSGGNVSPELFAETVKSGV